MSARSLVGGVLKTLRSTLARRSAYKFVVRDWSQRGDADIAADLLATMRFSRPLQPLVMDRPRAERILVIAPHPDDEMIGPGGTLLSCIEADIDVRVLYITAPSGQSGEARRRETAAVADRFGYSRVELGLSQGFSPPWDEAKAALARELRERAPDVIFTTFLLDDHRDHREANRLLAEVLQSTSLTPEIWSYQVYTTLPPNVVVDITSGRDRKAEAIALWRSAMASRDWVHYALGLNAFNSRWLPGSTPEPRWVEAFFVTPTPEYLELCRRFFPDPGTD